jgi:hypothetical protein
LVDADEESSLMKIGGVREVWYIPVDFSVGGSALPDLEKGLLAPSTSTGKP